MNRGRRRACSAAVHRPSHRNGQSPGWRGAGRWFTRCALAAGLLALPGTLLPAETGAGVSDTGPGETALTINLRPPPVNVPESEHQALATVLAGLLTDRKALDADLTAFLLKYPTEVTAPENEFTAFTQAKSQLLKRNDELLEKMLLYNQSALTALDRRIAKVQDQIVGTRKNLVWLKKSLLEQSEAFDELGEISREQRDAYIKTLQEQAKNATMDAGEELAFAGLERAASLNPWKANKLIAQLKRAGADNPDLLDAVKALGNAKDKPAKLAEAKRFYKLLKQEKKLWDAGNVSNHEAGDLTAREENLRALLMVISIYSPSPWLKVCAEGLFEGVKANLTAWYVLGSEEKLLSTATEAEARALKITADRYVELIKEGKRVTEERRLLPTRNYEVSKMKL